MGWRLHDSTHADRVVISFDGKLSADEGVASARTFAQAIDAHDSVDAVWDIRRLAGYERGAREAWQATLWPRRHKLRSVTVVGGRPLVRLGASTLGLALGVPISFRDEVDRAAS